MNLQDTTIDNNMRRTLQKSQGQAEAHRLIATLQMECLARRAIFLLRSGLIKPRTAADSRPPEHRRFGGHRIEQRLVSLFAD